MSTELRPLAVLLTASALIGCAAPTGTVQRRQNDQPLELREPKSSTASHRAGLYEGLDEERLTILHLLAEDGWFESTFRSRSERDLIYEHDWESGDLYRRSESHPTASRIKVASRTPDPLWPDLLVIPELDRPNDRLWSGRHSVHGDVYLMTSDWGPPIILVDSDGDSVLDGHFVARGTDWVTLGFADGERFDDLSQP